MLDQPRMVDQSLDKDSRKFEQLDRFDQLCSHAAQDQQRASIQEKRISFAFQDDPLPFPKKVLKSEALFHVIIDVTDKPPVKD